MQGRSCHGDNCLQSISSRWGEMNFKRNLLFLLLAGLFLPVSLSPHAAWEVKKNEKGIKVATRKADGYAVEEFKAETTIDIPLPEAVKILKDVPRYKKWMYRLLKAEIVKELSPDSKIIYMKIDLPWPAEDRDMYIQMSDKVDLEKGIYESTNTGIDGYPKTDCIRMTNVTFSWILKSSEADKNKTRVIYTSKGDPAGKLPSWICNLGNVENPYQCLYNLRFKYKKN
ncbi:MAG: hypothetical protein CVV44_05205 [Spirochaetae bacterium HGW-Spirochaetae-1]|nr:MAG: hypothetical protein CVV44_05205 [Spirochaetae bacterium HGW-Spirochaetae-1]